MAHFKWIFLILLRFIFSIMVSGCAQYTSGNQNPASVTQPSPELTPILTKNVGITAFRNGDTIFAVYQGGPDSDFLNQITVRIYSSAGAEYDYTYQSPRVGQQFSMDGFSGPNRVLTVGSFSDNTQQVILDTYI
jgi:hypothetical protein